MVCRIAVLWDSVSWEREEPSSRDYVNEGYEVFSGLAAERDAEVFMAHHGWYSGGKLEKAFRFDGSRWIKEEDVAVDVVFDKSDFGPETRGLKERLADEIPVLNTYGLESLAADKLECYSLFPELIPETREATVDRVEEMLETYGRVILKPRTGHGGEGVELLENLDELPEDLDGVLVQRFIDSSRGIPGLGIKGAHDLRMILLNGEVLKGQVRQPSSGWVSNVQRGGETWMMEPGELPADALELASHVSEQLDEFSPAFYSVDCIFDHDGKPWILEINSKPGLVFYGQENLRRDKKELMEEVVDTLVGMC